jgi:N-acyl homoserine lactone hydrolase
MTTIERADPKPSYFGKARPIDWPDTTYHLIDADTPVCNGLTLIPTPGHTPGHLSALVTLPDGRAVILAADAINRISEPDEAFIDAVDPVAAMESFHRLDALAKQSGATVIYGHEPSQWPHLPKAPTPW